MATRKKNAAKKSGTGRSTAGDNNKLTIDLGNLDLTVKETKKLLDAIDKTVSSKLKPKKEEKTETPTAPLKAGRPAAGAAEITVTVTHTAPGMTEITATHNSTEKNLDQSGTISFENVQKGDSIRIKGKSLGKTDFKIDRDAEPQQKNFEPGTFRFSFFILK